MYFPFAFSSTAIVGPKTSVWADDIKHDFIFGLALFFVPRTLVSKSVLKGVVECGIISPFVFRLVVNSLFARACWPTVGEAVNFSFSRLEGLKGLHGKSFKLDVENLMCGFSMNGAASSPLRYAMNAGSV